MIALHGDTAARQCTLSLRGTITGRSLGQLADVLDHLTKPSRPPATVLLDLRHLADWSTIAQAMVLTTSRRVTRHGGQFVLLDASARLRHHDARLDLFGRIVSGSSKSWPMPTVHMGVDVALLVIDQNRLLVAQSRVDPTIRLPGGALHDGEDAHHVLVRHATELGVDLKERSLKRSTIAQPSTAYENGTAVETIYFEAPTPDPPTRSDTTGLTWATSRTPGAFTPAASDAITTLHRGGYID